MTTVAWADLRAGLSEVFRVYAQMPLGSVTQSRDEPALTPDQHVATALRWKLAEIVPLGRAELTQAYHPEIAIPGDTYQPNPDNPDERLGAVVESVRQNLRLVVEVVIECDFQSVHASTFGRALASRIWLPNALDALAALGLALAHVRELGDDTFDGDDGSPVSAYVLALEFAGASDVSDTPVTTIENAVFAYTVT